MLDIKQLNSIVKTNEDFYDLIKEKRAYYLPKFNSPCITQDYLMLCAQNKVFTITYGEVKWTLKRIVQKKTRAELVDILASLSKSRPLGFDARKPPNKEWLVNSIHTLNPSHEIFSTPEILLQRSVPAE